MQINVVEFLQLDDIFKFLFNFYLIFIKFGGIDIWTSDLICDCRIYTNSIFTTGLMLFLFNLITFISLRILNRLITKFK